MRRDGDVDDIFSEIAGTTSLGHGVNKHEGRDNNIQPVSKPPDASNASSEGESPNPSVVDIDADTPHGQAIQSKEENSSPAARGSAPSAGPIPTSSKEVSPPDRLVRMPFNFSHRQLVTLEKLKTAFLEHKGKSIDKSTLAREAMGLLFSKYRKLLAQM